MHGCVVVEVSGGAMKMCLEVIFEVKKKTADSNLYYYAISR